MQNHNQKIEYIQAGFLMRFAAYAVDGIILAIGIGIIHTILVLLMKFLKDTPFGGEILFRYTFTDIVEYLLQALYFVLLTYFTGGTLGKKLLSLKVISLKENEKPGFVDVIYRETIGRYLSTICFRFGYLMVGIDKEKRALHDILCDTRVVQVRKVSTEGTIVKDVVVMPPKDENTVIEDQVPQMVEEPEKYGHSQEYVDEQWKKILERNS